MIRYRKMFRSHLVCLTVLLSCNILLASSPVDLSSIKTIKLVQVQNMGDAGYRMTKGSAGLGPAEGLNYRIDFYDSDGKMINMTLLTRAEKLELAGKLNYSAHDPFNNVLSSKVIAPQVEDNGIYITTTTGQGQGSARLEVSTPDGKVKGVQKISTGTVKTIGGPNTTPPAQTPDLFLPIMLGVGAAGAAAIAVGMAAGGAMGSKQYYIRVPESVQRMGVASVTGPYDSWAQADYVNRRYYRNRGEIYSKAADGSVFVPPQYEWVK